MRIAYADPPYLGQGHRYEEKKEVNHDLLISRLQEYDGWALSCSSPSLKTLLPMCPEETRVAAWVKPFAVFKPNVNPAYAWEPVLFVPCRKYERDRATVRDWVSANITLKKGIVGAKPVDFGDWLFSLLQMETEDSFEEIFPGTGTISELWNQMKMAI